jgi:hypothetical protein
MGKTFWEFIGDLVKGGWHAVVHPYEFICDPKNGPSPYFCEHPPPWYIWVGAAVVGLILAVSYDERR